MICIKEVALLTKFIPKKLIKMNTYFSLFLLLSLTLFVSGQDAAQDAGQGSVSGDLDVGVSDETETNQEEPNQEEPNTEDDDGDRIIGGTRAEPGEFPYQVALLREGRQICGGSIIANNWVLTAGHCVTAANGIGGPAGAPGLPARLFTVTAGAIDLRQSLGSVQVERVVVHPRYRQVSNGNMGNDIALLKLSQPIVRPGVSSMISLPRQGQSFAGQTAVASGFGRTDPNTKNPSPVLMKVNLQVGSDQTCQRMWGQTYDQTMVCAGNPGRLQTVCNGDSGGPLAVRNGNQAVVVGISSFVSNNRCVDLNRFAMFARVSNFIDSFINPTIRSG